MHIFADRQAFGSAPVHWHAWPGVVQVDPETAVQSAFVQQSLLEMQEFETLQKVSPPGHWQVPPGIGQISSGTAQSEQHVLAGMQMLPAMHACCPAGHDSPHAVDPPTVLQVWLGPQAFPQAPQLSGSVLRFAQYGAPPPSSPASSPAVPESPAGPAPSAPPAASPEPPPASGSGPASGGALHSVSGGVHE
jgi:hypothetical protein